MGISGSAIECMQRPSRGKRFRFTEFDIALILVSSSDRGLRSSLTDRHRANTVRQCSPNLQYFSHWGATLRTHPSRLSSINKISSSGVRPSQERKTCSSLAKCGRSASGTGISLALPGFANTIDQCPPRPLIVGDFRSQRVVNAEMPTSFL